MIRKGKSCIGSFLELMVLINKILVIIKIFFSIKKFTLPKKSNVLLVDEVTGKKISEYLGKNFSILHTRSENYNLSVLLFTFKNFLINKTSLNFTQLYFFNFIKFVNPKIIITCNDFDRNVWNIKKFFPDKKVVMIQNNVRNGWELGSQHITQIKKSKIDYCLTYGEIYKKYYQKFLKANFINIGSVLNNQVKKKVISNNKGLVFISQFKNWDKNSKTKSDTNNKINLYQSYLDCDRLLLKHCINFCNNKNIKIYILFRSNDPKRIKLEKKYYKKMFPKEKIIFLIQNNKKHTYQIIERFNYFVSIDSSLAYECLIKDKRVGYINFRYALYKFKGGKNHRYGWPGKFKKKGYFWTDSSSEKEINRVLKNLYLNNNSKWLSLKKKCIKPVIEYDYNNKKLKEILLKLT